MLARDLMSTALVTVRPSDNLETAVKKMVDNKVGCLPVVDESGKLVGVVTETDFQAKGAHAPFSLYAMPRLFGRWIDVDGLKRIYEEARDTPVSKIMARQPVSLDGTAAAEAIASLMLEKHIRHVVIVDEGRPVGIVARRDLMRALIKKA